MAVVRDRGSLGEMIHGATGVMTVKVVGAALAFGVNVLLARLMGVEDYGIYVYAYTWATMAALFGRMGVDNALMRFIPEYIEAEEWPKARGVLEFGLLVLVAGCTVVALSGSILVWLLKDQMPSSQPVTLWLGLAAVPVLGLVHYAKGTLQAFKRVVRAFSPDLIAKHALIAIGAGMIFGVNDGSMTAPQAMVVTLGAVIMALFVGGAFLNDVLPRRIIEVSGRKENSRLWLGAMVPMMLIAGMNILLRRTDLVMVGSLMGPESAGVYGAASRVSELSNFGLQAIHSIGAPLIAELYHSQEHRDLQELTTWAARGALAFSVTVGLGLLIGGRWVLGLFGEGFEAGFGTMMVLVGGQVVSSFAGIVGFVMMMTGHQQEQAKMLGVAVVVNIVMNVLLVPIWGLVGAAVATATAMVLWNGAMVLYTNKAMDIDTTAAGLL